MKRFFIFLMSLLAVSCEIVDVEGVRETRPDSLTTVVGINPVPNLKSADVFLYGDEGVRRLEGHVHLDSVSGRAVFRTLPGDKLVVVLGNVPRDFNDLALTSYDSMEILPFYYCDESPVSKMCSGTLTCSAGDTVAVKLSSYLCRVNLVSVEHKFTGYKRLEDPLVRLENVSSRYEALRRDTFMPTEFLKDTLGMRGIMWETLPSDVGMYAQRPGISLMCYPNESSVSRSRIVVEGKVDGAMCKFSADLPALTMGCTVHAELKIDSTPSKYTFNVY